jgi:hypothetical protein
MRMMVGVDSLSLRQLRGSCFSRGLVVHSVGHFGFSFRHRLVVDLGFGFSLRHSKREKIWTGCPGQRGP